MKIKNRLTEEEKEVTFHSWRTSINNKEIWKIIDRGDTVYVYELEKDLTKKYLYELDRDHAHRIIKTNSERFGFVEISEVSLEVRIKMILTELSSRKNNEGELVAILKDVGIKYLDPDKKEIVDYLSNNQLSRVTSTKDGIFLSLTSKGLEFAQRVFIANSSALEVKADSSEPQKEGLYIREESKRSTDTHVNAPTKTWQIIGVIVSVVFGLIMIYLALR